jgi:transposase
VKKMRKRMGFMADQVAEIQSAKRKNRDKNVDRRLKAILLYAQGEKSKTIAEATGYTESCIYAMAARYRREGIGALVENHYAGNHRNMSHEEEALFLKGYEERSASGEIVDVREIKADYAKKVGRETRSRGQIYALLKRHGWRKVMPRSRHPKAASEAEREASKKLTLR